MSSSSLAQTDWGDSQTAAAASVSAATKARLKQRKLTFD